MLVLRKKRIGIIGGMGNEAMLDLLKKISSFHDSQQYEFIAFGNARLAYKPNEVMQTWGPRDLAELRKKDTALFTLDLMQKLNVDCVGLACNSAHDLFRKLIPKVRIPFVDMIKETAQAIVGTHDNVLVMGVDSIIQSELYQKALKEKGISSSISSFENQKKIMEAIYNKDFGIKTAKITLKAQRLLCEVIKNEYRQQNIRKVILGCTELPLALTQKDCEQFKEEGLIPNEIEMIDASHILGRALLNSAIKKGSRDATLKVSQGQHTDWFAPLTFKVDSPFQMACIQEKIIQKSISILAKQGKTITGSYVHIPTLFISNSAKDALKTIEDRGIPLFNANKNLNIKIEKALLAYYDPTNSSATHFN